MSTIQDNVPSVITPTIGMTPMTTIMEVVEMMEVITAEVKMEVVVETMVMMATAMNRQALIPPLPFHP
ncbi:MAG: hypothetical protein ACK2T5_17400 [Anaerolineales bacterium]